MDDSKPILEEHAMTEGRGMLGGKRIETTQEGKLHRTAYLATCNFCGRYPLDSYVMCFSCGGRLCTKCENRFNGLPYCRTHLAEVAPLSRNGYKILRCIKAEIESVSKIANICRLDKDDVKSSLAVLREMKYITTSGFLAFLSRKVTADGVRVLSVYSKIFDPDEDVADMRNRLQEDQEDQVGT